MKIKKVKATNLSAGQLVFDLEPSKIIAPVLFEVVSVSKEDNEIKLKPVGDVCNYTVINGYVNFNLTNDWYLVK